MQDKLNELKKRLGEISDIQNAVSLLGWDQQTYMPPGGADARAQQIATLSHLAHEKFIDDAIGRLLEELHGFSTKLSYDSDDASLVRVAKRDYDKARRIPPSWYSKLPMPGRRHSTPGERQGLHPSFLNSRPFSNGIST